MIRLSALVLVFVPMILLAQQPWEPVEIQPPQGRGNQKDNQKAGLSYNGTEWFRLALANQGLEPELNLDNAFDNPQSTIIMILGNTSPLNNRRDNLERFLKAGGSLMIASDNTFFGGEEGAWNALFGVTIPNARIYDPIDCFREYPNCPYVTVSTTKENIENSGSRIFRRVEGRLGEPSRRLLTNDPAVLQFVGNPPQGVKREHLAYFSNVARLGRDGPRLFQERQFAQTFATAFHFPNDGKALLLADHSVFINNSMMVYQSQTSEGLSFGTANYAFTEDTAEWLAGSGQNRKTKCIVFVDGRVQQVFALPPPPIPDIMPPPDLLAQALKGMLNPFLDSLQKDNFFNKLLLKALDQKGWVWFVAAVLFVLPLLRQFRALYRAASRLSNSVIETKPPPNKENLNRQTMREMLSNSDWLYAARRRVRAWLTRFDVNLDQPQMPPVLIASGSNNAQAIKSSLQRLWDVAQGRMSEFNLSDWDRFNQDLERLAKAAKRGEWTFAVEKS